MATLEELFDTAGAHLRAAAEQPVAADRAAVSRLLDQFLADLAAGLSIIDDASPASDLRFHLAQARDALQTAQRLLPPPAVNSSGSAGDGIAGATAAVNAVRDVIESHHGPNRVPLTAYAYAFSTHPARDYLARRSAELAWEANRIALALGRDIEDPGVEAAFADVRSSLAKAAVFGWEGTRNADWGIAAFSLALPVEPVQAHGSDDTRDVPERLAEDCDRLSRAAFDTLHDRSGHRLSGSDLQQLSRWTAMGRLLSGRLLLRVAEQLPEPAIAAVQREAAGALRSSAQAWQQSAAAWHRIVDLADPRAHPKLPPPSYDIVRRGQVVRLPQVVPHPATVIAHTSAVRVGQLLFGAQWRPDGTGRPQARPVRDILDDVRGVGALAAVLYRLPATGWQLAAAAPLAVERAQSGLVTDSVEHRPGPDHPGQRRFYPVHHRQLEALTGAYRTVMPAEQTAAAALLEAARQVGATVPRALLDATAHRNIAAQQQWGEAQAPPPAVRAGSPVLRTQPSARRGGFRL
ncbi:hypothetical protein ACFWWB_38470 [Streptomyces sp. NPDC058690]|uniref:hypothetical protein n=1 Tax=Streptomyces sp. NPDC058690 TaxID=3346600 RepID=UPI00364BD9AB